MTVSIRHVHYFDASSQGTIFSIRFRQKCKEKYLGQLTPQAVKLVTLLMYFLPQQICEAATPTCKFNRVCVLFLSFHNIVKNSNDDDLIFFESVCTTKPTSI